MSIALEDEGLEEESDESRMYCTPLNRVVELFFFSNLPLTNLNTATIILAVQYTADYPDEAPNLDLTPPPNAPKHPHFDIQDDKAHLLSSLQPTIEENLGMAMIFTLVTQLKESAEELIRERRANAAAVRDAAIAKAEEEENRRFHGTVVNRESFLAWRAKFKAEIEEEERKRQEEIAAEEKKKKGAAKDESRLTGRQLWEKGLASTLR